MVGEAVQQGSGEPFGSKDVGPLVEGEVGGDQDGAPFVALAEDLEEEFRPGGGQRTKPSSSMISSLRRESCRCRLSRRRSSRASISSWTRAAAVVKPTDIPFWQAARPSPRATWVLPVPLFPTAITFSLCSMYSHRANSMTRTLFTEGMARKSKVSRLLTAGKRAARMRRWHHALVAVDEFQFGETQQVVRVVHILGGALGGQLAVLPEEGGQPQFLQVMLQEQRGPVAHAALPAAGPCSPWRWWSSR